MRQILVTTGATVTFKKLIESVINNEFLNTLIEYKFDRIVIQYGKSKESIVFLRNLIKKLDNDMIKGYKEYEDFKNNTGFNFEFDYNQNKLKVLCIQFDSQLTFKFTKDSDIVISHAGTGSIIDTLRIKERDIKLIVMINEGLKDNHQIEIANAFESIGVVKSIRGNPQELLKAFKEIEEDNENNDNQIKLKRLPEANGSVIEQVITEEMLA